jgi:hypothetical protein
MKDSKSASPLTNDEYVFLPNAKHRTFNGQVFLSNDDHTFIPADRNTIHQMVHHQESGDFPTVRELPGEPKFRHSPAPGGMISISNKPKR